jgi:hypothetical protein
LIDVNGNNEEKWREFLKSCSNISGTAEAIKGFLLAVRDCCMARKDDQDIPEFVLEELKILIGL